MIYCYWELSCKCFFYVVFALDIVWGLATCRDAEGATCVGTWVNNTLHGIGACQRQQGSSGDMFVGEFAGGRAHGRGGWFGGGGRLLGEFVEDEAEGQVTWWGAGGERLEGEYR